MNQAATVDMPDPLDASPPPNLAGTDDLLAQLADDEIDRLLAESEVERVAAAAAAATAKASEAVSPPAAEATQASPPAIPSDDAELDELLNQLADEAAPAPDAAASVVDPVAQAAVDDAASKPRTLTEQVPELLAQHPAPPPAAAPPPPVSPTTGAPVSAAAAAPETSDGVMTPAEREALGLSSLAEATDAAEKQDAAAAATTKSAEPAPAANASVAPLSSEVSPRLAPVVRVLEWINSPLAFVPDRARDVLGKVAIATLVNSLAVLIYVLFIRH